MALTPEQIDKLIQQADGNAAKEGSIFRALVKLTEAEVSKQLAKDLEDLKSDLSDYMQAANAEANLATQLLEKKRQDENLMRSVLRALEYHVEQTRPITSTLTAIAELKERLSESVPKLPAQG